MRLIEAARAESILAGYEPKAPPRCIVPPVRSHRDHLRHPAFPVRPKPLDAIAFLAPILGVRLDLPCEGVVGIPLTRRDQIARSVALLIIEGRIVDVPRQKQDLARVLGLGDDMDLMSAFSAESGRIEAMARRAGVFELTFEQDISGLFGQRGENLARAGDELVKLKGQECTCPRAAPLRFREADAG